jgi:RimJ/RimL family protein N-acetyltransferase
VANLQARLRKFEREDLSDLLRWTTDLDQLGPYVQAEDHKLIDWQERFDQTNLLGPEEWFYLYESDEGVKLGYAHFWKCDRYEDHLEFGRVLDKEYRNKGLGLAFLKKILDLIFESQSCFRVQAITAADNKIVQKQWQQAGIRNEGILRSFMTVRELRLDCAIGSILRHEWQEQKAQEQKAQEQKAKVN